MRIKGRVLRFNGEKDYQGEKFSADCQVILPGNVANLPVYFASHPKVEIGKVDSVTFAADGLYAQVRIDHQYAELVSIGQVASPTLGLSLQGLVQQDSKGPGACVISRVGATGIMIGVNVDPGVGGFELCNPEDARSLDSILHTTAMECCEEKRAISDVLSERCCSSN